MAIAGEILLNQNLDFLLNQKSLLLDDLQRVNPLKIQVRILPCNTNGDRAVSLNPQIPELTQESRYYSSFSLLYHIQGIIK